MRYEHLRGDLPLAIYRRMVMLAQLKKLREQTKRLMQGSRPRP